MWKEEIKGIWEKMKIFNRSREDFICSSRGFYKRKLKLGDRVNSRNYNLRIFFWKNNDDNNRFEFVYLKKINILCIWKLEFEWLIVEYILVKLLYYKKEKFKKK